MTVTETGSQAHRLDDAEYEAALARLREYDAHVRASEQTAQAQSLQRAADMARVYTDGRWADDMPIPKRTHFRGRPIDRFSRARFASWVKKYPERAGRYQPSHCYQLLNADTVRAFISATAEINTEVTERTLRPLSKLLRDGRVTELADVWHRAELMADGAPLTYAHVRQALAEHETATGRRLPRAASYVERNIQDARKKLLREFDWILANGSSDDINAVLDEVVARVNALNENAQS